PGRAARGPPGDARLARRALLLHGPAAPRRARPGGDPPLPVRGGDSAPGRGDARPEQRARLRPDRVDHIRFGLERASRTLAGRWGFRTTSGSTRPPTSGGCATTTRTTTSSTKS